ncbi:MAG: N-acetylmuramoyl-L-alanine amidase [Oscillatoriaceae cyanobacterium]
MGPMNTKVGKTLLRHWLLPGIVGAFLAAAPAEAAVLQSWRFQAAGNQLSFVTAGGVQPQAQLIADPVRLVIDLPGTTLGNIRQSQRVGGAIREIRVGQVDSRTARIVVELANGYTIDPSQVKFRGLSAESWTVELPSPQRIDAQSGRTLPNQNSGAIAAASTVLQDIQVGDTGIVLQTSGSPPQIDVKQAGDRSWMSVDLTGVTISPSLGSRNRAVNSFGVERLQVMQISSSPPVTRVTLNMGNRGQDWETQVSSNGGVLLWPKGSTPPTLAAQGGPATIESVQLRNNGTELVVRGDKPLTFTSGWDRQTAAYGITIYSARLSEDVELPRGGSGSPVLWVRQRQDKPNSVTLLLQPGAGVEILGVNQPSAQQLSLQVRPGSVAVTPPDVPPPTSPSTYPVANPPRPVSEPDYPRLPNQRVVIVVDPGHGGSDAGAIGIGGLREKDLNLDVGLQVAQILEQNGIQAVLTRRDDRDVELEPRTVLANRINADLFVSIHANAIDMSRPDVNGIETYYYESGRALAEYIHRSILESFDVNDRGVRRARFYVLRHTNMPAVLVEMGFVTGRDDARMLADPAQRQRMAQAIARGIMRYAQAGR